MNVVNRLLAIVILVAILVLSLGAIGIATGLLTLHTVDSAHAYAPLHTALSDFHTSHPQETRVLKVAVAAAVGLGALLLLLAELRPPRRERSLRLSQSKDGDVTIGYNTVRQLAELAGTEVSGTQRARCRVARDGNSLRVWCRVAVDRYANAELVGSQVETAIRQQLEQTLGRPVERVQVRVESPRRDARARVR